MNNFNKIRKNAKALSPVVASIILIAVTVAVSIAVAAWMGGLVGGFMGATEQAEVRTLAFSNSTETPPVQDNVTATIKNSGTASITVEEIWINNADVTANSTISSAGLTIEANKQGTITVSDYPWIAGDNYQVKIVTSQGHSFMKNTIPPV